MNLKTVDWEFAQDQSSQTQAVFRYEIPGKFRLEKRYELKKGNDKGGYSKEIRDTNTEGYFLHLTVSAKNLQAEKPRSNTNSKAPWACLWKIPKAPASFATSSWASSKAAKSPHDSVTAKDLVKSIEKNDVEEWSAPFRYVGVDGQFFATLLYNDSEKPTTEKIASYKPDAVWIDKDDAQMSDVSIELTSKPLTLAAGRRRSSITTRSTPAPNGRRSWTTCRPGRFWSSAGSAGSARACWPCCRSCTTRCCSPMDWRLSV